jgi:GTPase involved in cell partitioning and DNA repair
MLNRTQLFELICDAALSGSHAAWKVETLNIILEELNMWDKSLRDKDQKLIEKEEESDSELAKLWLEYFASRNSGSCSDWVTKNKERIWEAIKVIRKPLKDNNHEST